MTSARLTRPSIGETTLVNSRSSSAARSAAATASTCAAASVGGARRGARAPRATSRSRSTAGRRGACSDAGAVARGRGLRQLGAQPVDLRLEGAVVELEQDLSLTHQAAFLERHARDQARDARPDADRLHGFEAAGELVPLGDVARDGRGRGHLRERWRGRLRSGRGCTRRARRPPAITAPARERDGSGRCESVKHCVNMPAACARGRSRPQSGRIAEAKVLRRQHGRIARPGQAGIGQKDDAAGRPPGRVAGAARSPHNRGHVRHPPTSPQPAALREALAPERRDRAADRGARGAARRSASAPSAWPRSRATPCSWRSTCWSRIPICAASSASSSSGWSTTPRRTPAACGCSTTTSGACDLWMANIGGETLHGRQRRLGVARSAAREHEPRTWRACEEGRTRDRRIRGRRRAAARGGARRSIAAAGVKSLLVAPLHLPPKTLGWIALSSVAGLGLRAALAAGADRRDGAAGDAGALLQPARRSQPARGAAPGGARRAQSHRARHPRHAGAGLRRDPHAVAGGAAHRRAEPAAGAGAQPRDRRRSGAHAPGRGAPLGRGAAAAVGRARRRRRRARAHGRSRAPHQRRARRAGGRRTAGVRGRRRARDRRHRPGSADQRRPPRARPPHRRPRRRRARRRVPACRWPTMAAASTGDCGRRRLRHDQHARAGRAHRRVADLRHRAARRHRGRARVAAGVVLDPASRPMPTADPRNGGGAERDAPGARARRRRSLAAAHRRRQHHQPGARSRGRRRGRQRPRCASRRSSPTVPTSC